MNVYDDEEKQRAWEAAWEVYKLGHNVESYSRCDERVAQEHFERAWSK